MTIVTTAGTTFHRQVLTTQNSLISRTVPTARLISETENSEIIYLFLGKIFQQEDLSVTSRSSNNTAEMSATNNQLIVSMSVDVVFADEVTSDAQLLSRIRGILNGVELYHSYAVYLTRTVNNEKNRIIIGNPSTSGSYYRIDGGDAAIYGGTIVIGEDEEEEIINLPPVNVNSNFAEFVTENLSGRFAGNSDAVEINISATITLTYSIEAIYRQFPQGSASEETDGVTVSATSNLAFSASSTSYSKNSEEKDDEEENIYYSTGEGETAMLYLGVVGDREGDYSPLGINPKTLGPDVTNYKFKLSGVLDISGIYSSVNDYDSISVSIELYQKTNGGYVSVASLDDYLNSVYVYLDDEHKIIYENDEIVNDVLTADNNEVVLETTGSSPNILFYIDVNVITGAAFEANNNLYTNYQLVVSANVMKNGSTYGGISDASNFVIYTHAKVLSDFIRTN